MKNYVTVITVLDEEKRIEQILDILGRGNYVKFCLGESYKIITKYEPDEDGDLTADYISPEMRSKFICPFAIQYAIQEITPLEFKNLK